MRKWMYLAAVMLFFFFNALNEVVKLESYKFDMVIMLLLACFLIFVGISVISYRAALYFRKIHLIYFCFSYLLLGFATFIFLKRTIAHLIFDQYYFYTLRFIEIIIYYFGLYVFSNNNDTYKSDKELVKKSLKKFLKKFLVLLFNILLLYIFLRNKLLIYIPLIIYVQLYFAYRNIKLTDEKRYFTLALEFKVVSECIFILSYYFKLSPLYISGVLFYILSLMMIWNYLMNIINRGYYRNLYNKERKINKLLAVNDKAIILVENDFIKKMNKNALELLEINNSYELKGKNIHTLIDDLEDEYEGKRNYIKSVMIKKSDGTKNKVKLNKQMLQHVANDSFLLILEEELTISRLFYEINNIIENIVYIYEENYGYKFVGDSVENILGYTPKDFYKNKYFSKEISLDGKFLDTVSKRIEKNSFIAEYKTKFGEIKYLKETIKKLEIGDNVVYYGVATDVTDLKKEIIESHERIAALKEIDAKKDISMSIVSHEIRTPITAIIGFLENIIMNNHNVDIRILNMINKVYSNAMRLKELVNNMLDLNKLNAGKLEIFKEDNDLKELVHEVLINNETLLEINKLKYVNLLTESVNVYADSSMLYQIINNIISNAIKYNREKGTITISKNELENEVILKISDTGLGIKEENKDKVFKEYERVKGTKRKGTGLGLPLVKKLIELNDGKIWFESEIDKGTTFYLMFKKVNSGKDLSK